jgi:hypothetical protein
MRRRRTDRSQPPSFDPLEERSLLSTLIALIDSGVDLNSTLDAPYYDFTQAYDAYNEQPAALYGNQVVQDTSLPHGHGSSVADLIVRGIQDAEAQPGAATAGVQIMPIRDTSSGLNVDSNALLRGIYWAADHGAAVINLSVSYNGNPVLHDPMSPHDGSSLAQAIAYAQSKGAVVVTGSGNDSANIDQLVVFPPYADDPVYSDATPLPSNLLVAAAVDSTGNLTSVSNWGPVHVDLGAYTNTQGFTSYSSGYTAGVAGVIAELLPPGHSAQDVKSVIVQTVTPHAQSVGPWCASGGVISPAAAVARVMAAGVSLDAGGSAAGSFSADGDFSGGTTYSVKRPIDTSDVHSPAPQTVYQTERYGNFTYTLPHLLPDTPYMVRLDFAEIYWDTSNQRLFNVLIGGNPVLTNFDIFAAAGGKDRAIDRQFVCQSDASGKITVQFVTLRDNAKISGITVTPAPDLALNKPAVSSSIEGPGFTPDKALDANSATRWSSGQWMQNSQVGWISVDLGAPYQISQVRLNWETAYAMDYQVQVSDDGVNWVAIASVEGNQSNGIASFTGLAATGRYVRIYCTRTSAGSDNYSLYDLNVYGAPVFDLAQGRPVYSSTIESSYYAPSQAVDGNHSTRWSSGQWMQNSSVGWIYVDLGATYAISEVRLNWETAYALDYQIQVSNDAASWTSIEKVTGNQNKGWFDFQGLSGSGRYVRIYCTRTSSGADNYSLYDLEVFGAPLVASATSLQPAGTLTTLVSPAQNAGAVSLTPTGRQATSEPPAHARLAARLGAGHRSHHSRHVPHRPGHSARPHSHSQVRAALAGLNRSTTLALLEGSRKTTG